MPQHDIVLHFRTFPEDHLWVGKCVELDIASGGDTSDEAFRNVLEATQLHLEALAEYGELETFLHEHGSDQPHSIEERELHVGVPA